MLHRTEKTILITAMAVSLAACRNATAQDASQIERGATVYAAQRCAICHSIAGKGDVKGPLDDVGSRLKADEIRLWMVNPAEMTRKTNAKRKPLMRAYPKLPKEDLDALVAYMLSLRKP